MKPFIGYHFLHGAGKISPADAYYRSQNVMSLYSDQKAPSRRTLTLHLEKEPKEGPLESLFHQLCRKYSPISHTTGGFSLGPNYRAHQWELRNEEVAEALSHLEIAHAQIPLAKDRLQVTAFWRFKFVEPGTGNLLPDQEGLPEIDFRLGPGSSFSLTTGKKTWVNAWFLFPFERPSPEFEDYVFRFQSDLIFKFSPKHWRLWKSYPVRGWWPKKFVPNWYAK